MTTTAPRFNSFNAFDGETVARPSAFWAALDEADVLLAECGGLGELRCRVQELEAQVVELLEDRADTTEIHMQVVNENARLRQERDALRAAVTSS